MNTKSSKDLGLEINIKKKCYNQYMFMTDLVEQDNYHVLGNSSNKWG
jgi:hypothetical protein